MKNKIICFLLFGVFLLTLTLQLQAQSRRLFVTNMSARYFKKNHIAKVVFSDIANARSDSTYRSTWTFDKQGRITMVKDSTSDGFMYCNYLDSLGRVAGIFSKNINELPPQYLPDTMNYSEIKFNENNLLISYYDLNLHRYLKELYDDSTKTTKRVLVSTGKLFLLRNDTDFAYNITNGNYTLVDLSLEYYEYSAKRIVETNFSFEVNKSDTIFIGAGVGEYDKKGRLMHAWCYSAPGLLTISETPRTIQKDWTLTLNKSYSYGKGNYVDMEEVYERDLLNGSKKEKLEWSVNPGKFYLDYEHKELVKLIKSKSPAVVVTYY